MRLTLFLCFSIFSICANAQMLNGGFEEWIDDDPLDWKTSGYHLSDSSLTGSYCIRLSVAEAAPYEHSNGFTLVTNSIPKHPNGFAVPPNATSISFWYKFYNWFQLNSMTVSTSMSDKYSLEEAHTWTKLTIPIVGVKDSITIKFDWQPVYSNHWDCIARFFLDDIQFETSQSSIIQKVQSSKLDIFPNPASSIAHLYISSKSTASTTATLIDLTGREVMSFPFVLSNDKANSAHFDVNRLPNGIYYLKCFVDGNMLIQKFIVAH